MPLMQCCNTEELTDTLLRDMTMLQGKLSSYKAKRDSLLSGLSIIRADIDAYNKRKQMIENAKQYYLKVVDMCYMHSIGEMEDFVNHVLGYVFVDESYRIKLDITNKHNKSITFYLIDEKKNLETPLRKGNGKGVKAVVSFVLLTYYLLKLKSNYLFLDEAFVNISAGYIQRFFEYVKYLCNKHNLCVVLITHDVRLPEYADVIYKVEQGNITKIL